TTARVVTLRTAGLAAGGGCRRCRCRLPAVCRSGCRVLLPLRAGRVVAGTDGVAGVVCRPWLPLPGVVAAAGCRAATCRTSTTGRLPLPLPVCRTAAAVPLPGVCRTTTGCRSAAVLPLPVPLP